MQHQRAELDKGGAGPSWSGFPLERHQVSSGYESSRLWTTSRLILVTAGQVRVQDRALPGRPSFLAGPGSVTLWPGGHRSRALLWSGPCDALDVELNASVVERLAPDHNLLDGASLIAQPGITDPQLAALIRGMEAEVDAGCPAGRLYGESLSLAVAAHVAARFGSARPTTDSLGRGLCTPRLRRVLDYIHAHLGGDLGLAELAGVAGLSPQRFSAAFRAATGETPHRYVTRERVRAARRLLAQPHKPLAAIAFELGFSSQSHFTHTFHRLTGTTPSRFRRER
jgi:AraC family transcriptional regulator